MKKELFNSTKLQQQIEFIIEIDKLKSILRKTKILNSDRRENSAEHSWQLALAAMILSEHCNETINVAHVIKMLLVHDLVEIYAGDVFLYDKPSHDFLFQEEMEAAEKIFSILPKEQNEELLELWKEFDTQETMEARFANSIDRLIPILLNFSSEGNTWKEFSITADQVIDKNEHIKDGSQVLWDLAEQIIQEAINNGYLIKN